jgi:hypothetical protein
MKYIFGVWVDYDGNVYRRDLRYSHKPFVKVHFDKSKNEYLRVTINNKTYKVHRLIAMAFIPNPENKRTVNHKDGNKQNNAANNLEWVTRRENEDHAMANGMKPKGERNGGAKISDADAEYIRKNYIRRNGVGLLAKKFVKKAHRRSC